jgi:hypothetical protein
MSMNYGVVKPSFWTGATGRALRQDVDAQVVALYLMTSPHANIIGVFRCPIDYIKLETGRTIEGASKGLTKLCQIGFCTFDASTDTVWVHEMARFQIGDMLKGADKRIKHVARFFDEIENPHIKRAFFDKYGAAYQLAEPPVVAETGRTMEGASKPLQSPIEATVTVTDTGTAHPSDGGKIQNSKPTAKPKQAVSKPMPDESNLDFMAMHDLFIDSARKLHVGDAENEFSRFVDHHRAKGSVFADWQAAGRTWLRNSIKFNSKPGGGGSGQRPNGGFTNLLLEQQAERMNGSVTIDHDDLEFSPR